MYICFYHTTTEVRVDLVYLNKKIDYIFVINDEAIIIEIIVIITTMKYHVLNAYMYNWVIYSFSYLHLYSTVELYFY